MSKVQLTEGLYRVGAIDWPFGSHGWASSAVRAIQQELGQAGIEVLDSDLAFKFVPDRDETKKCTDFGQMVAKRIK